MAETLIMQSIDTDNRITVDFADATLPRYGRHGELFVVNGILYIYADLDNSNHGRWFPLTNEKEMFVYNQDTPSNLWSIPVDFHTDNVQVIVYDDNELLYQENFGIDIENNVMELAFVDTFAGKAHIIVNKAFDWVDRRFVVADKNFAITSEQANVNAYYVELNTEYVEILKNGNTTFRSDVVVEGTLNVTSITNVNQLIIDTSTLINNNLDVVGNVSITGNTLITGDLTIQGTTTTVDTNTISLSDNVITLNSDQIGPPTLNASVDINRGDEGILSILNFDEINDYVTLPIKQTDGSFIQDEVIGRTYVDSKLQEESDRAIGVETELTSSVENNYTELNDKIFNETIRSKNAETSLTNILNSEISRATHVEGLLRVDVDLKAPQETTYTKDESDALLAAATVPQVTLDAIKQVHGSGSGLDADFLDGFNSTHFNHEHGLSRIVQVDGANIIARLKMTDGVVKECETRMLTLDDLGYTEEQAIDTIIGLRDLLNAMMAKIDSLEKLIKG